MAERFICKGGSSRKSSGDSPQLEGSRESGECSSSSCSSSILIDVIDDGQESQNRDNPSEDIILLSGDWDASGMALGDDSDDSVQFVDSVDDEGLFVLDKSGSVGDHCGPSNDDEGYESGVKKRRSPPLDISKVLTSAVTPSSISKKKEKFFKTACFNCGGDHMLEKCDIPHDGRRIARNRAEYYNSKRSMNERYLDTNINDSIRPGYVSDELREALGIGPRDIPEWIYRMRRLGFIDGYPPAYLKQAIDTSGDALLEFHMEDDTTQPGGSGASEKDHQNGLPPKINAAKMIYYFGFNYYSRQLRDRETNFRIPDFRDFVDYHQLVLNERYWAEQSVMATKCSSNLSRFKRKGSPLNENIKKQRSDGKEEDVEVIDMDVETDSGDDICVLPPPPTAPGLHSETITKEGKSVVTPKRVKSSPALLGSSTRVVCGTPIGLPTSQTKKPELDKFRAGVVPFKHEPEDTSHRGFFTALMKKIRSAL